MVTYGIIFSASTVILIKYYIRYSNYWFLLATILSEFLLIYSYINFLDSGILVVQFAIIKILSIILVAIPSLLFFDGVPPTKQIIGLLIGLLSIYLLNSN